MAFIPTPHAIRLSLQFVWAGQVVEVTIALLGTAAATEPDLTTLANVANPSWATNLMSILSSGLSFTGVKAVAQDSSSAPSVTFVRGTPLAGSGGTSVPNNAALTISMRTPSRGRSFRGRMYLPGIPQSSLASSTTWGTTTLTNVLTAFADFIDDIKSGGLYKIGVISTISGGSPRSSGVFTEYNAYNIDQDVNSMRRRLAGRGA